MNIAKMIDELRAEREKVEFAIITLQRIALGTRKRRGRPPKWMSDMSGPKKRAVGPEARKRMSEAQTKRWAAERTATG